MFLEKFNREGVTCGLDLEGVDGRKTSASRSTPSIVHFVGAGSAANTLEPAQTNAATQHVRTLVILLRDGQEEPSVAVNTIKLCLRLFSGREIRYA
jgi:hypothetical protein